MKIFREILYWILLAALLTAGGFLLFTNLGEAPISDCDEARHGVNAYEMMQSGDYLVTTFQGEPDYWNLKPPLSEYAIIAGYQLFGPSAFGMRFYSALSMLLIMAAVALWCKKYYGSIASLFSVGFWLASTMVYGPHFARFGDADAQMLFFYTLAMLCMLQSIKNVRWLYGSAICFGLAFMSKSWHAALIPVTCFLFVCVTGQIKKLKWHQYLLLIFFGLLPIAPWAIARYQFDGLDFFRPMFFKDVVARATTVHEGHFGGWLYYIEYLLSDPVIALSVILIAFGLVYKFLRRTKVTAMQWGILLWAAVPLVFYTLCVSKLAWYIFVSLPALAIGMGLACRKVADGLCVRSKTFLPRLVCLALAVSLIGIWGWRNWEDVSNQINGSTYQELLNEYFDPDFDSGTKIYIQYESENAYAEANYRAWRQNDMLCAMLAGDLICMDGGIEGFLQEEDHAYLMCHWVGMDWDILGEYPIVLQYDPVMLIENWN